MTTMSMTMAALSGCGCARSMGSEVPVHDLPRRHFLSTAGAALLAGAAAPASAEGQVTARKTGIRVGTDTDKQPAAIKRKGAIAMLDYVKENGFDGACFRLIRD